MKHAPREHQRVYLTFFLRIYDNKNLAGYLLDISEEGLMLISETPLTEKKTYGLYMKLPPSLGLNGIASMNAIIGFSAECRWCRPDEDDRDFFLSGLSFSELKESDKLMILRLMEEYRLR